MERLKIPSSEGPLLISPLCLRHTTKTTTTITITATTTTTTKLEIPSFEEPLPISPLCLHQAETQKDKLELYPISLCHVFGIDKSPISQKRKIQTNGKYKLAIQISKNRFSFLKIL